MSSNSREEEPSPSTDLKFTMEAMMKQFECFGNLFQQNNERLEYFEARMTEIERRQHPRQYPRKQDKRRTDKDEYEDVSGDDFEDDEPATFEGNTRRNIRRNDDGVYHNVGSIQMKIPHFQGKNDPDAYLE